MIDVWAKRPEPHSTPETAHTIHDNCPHLSCIEQDKARLHKWNYYCELRHKKMTHKELYETTSAECPEHRRVRRGKR